MRHAHGVAWLAAVSALAACGQGRAGSQVYALQASGGAYDDGSGRTGVAIVATLRDATGTGPRGEWTGTLSDASGARATFTYADGSAGSVVATWWPDVAFADSDDRLALEGAGGSASANVRLRAAGAIGVPQVRVSADGAALVWNPIAGAAAYTCMLTDGGGAFRTTATHDPSCAIGDLPDGGWTASVLAYSADVALVAADVAQRPALPPRFDVSEGRVAFVRDGAAPAAVVVVAGGALDYGLGTRTLATWIAIRNADGSPTATAWDVAISGPDLPEDAPLRFTYPANFSQRLVWSYDQPATAGLYNVVATSGTWSVRARFSVGEPAPLDAPAGVTARDGAQGSATVDWTPVAGARSYLVGVWQGADFVTTQWVAAPPAGFPQGAFTVGQAYDVYVAATDADMVGGPIPLQVSVTENTLQPAGFVAR